MKYVIIVMKEQFSKGVLDVVSAFADGMQVHGVITVSVNDIFWQMLRNGKNGNSDSHFVCLAAVMLIVSSCSCSHRHL